MARKCNLGQKRPFEKSDFLGFPPKLLPILDFKCRIEKNAKIQPKTKVFSKLSTFLQFLATCQKFFGLLI